MVVDMATSRNFDRTFRITVALKGLDGLLEVVIGAALLLVSPDQIRGLVRALTAHELAQDPTDFFATHLLHSANTFSPHASFYGAVYLLAHGVAKVVLVILVLRNKLWAYPWMIALLLGFIVYQVYLLTTKLSVWIIALTLFDALVVYLTAREYRSRRQARVQEAQQVA